MAINTYYTLLGIPESASFDEIQKAYRKKAFEYHPDRNKEANANEMFIKIQNAYEVLSDPARRIKYDTDLNAYRQKIFMDMRERYNQRQNTYTNNWNQTRDNNTENKSNEQQNHYNTRQEKSTSNNYKPNEHNKKSKIDTKSKREKFVAFIIIFLITFFTYKEAIEPALNRNKQQTEKKSSSDNNKNVPSIEKVSEYKGNHLENGDSPYSKYFGSQKYNFEYDSYILIYNGTQQDAIVIFQDVVTNMVIRNSYVNKNSYYTVKNFPEGIYRMKCVYGNDWNPNLYYKKQKIGMFETNVSFSSQSNPEDYFNMMIEKTDNGYYVPSYQVTLHKVENGNMKTEKISKSDFFD